MFCVEHLVPDGHVFFSTDTDIAGSTVYHGTLEGMVESVTKGPRNVGKGFGGSGLYTTPEGVNVASEFTNMAMTQNRECAGVVMSGVVTNRPLKFLKLYARSEVNWLSKGRVVALDGPNRNLEALVKD